MPQNGAPAHAGISYVVAYQAAEIIALDSSGDIEAQTAWMQSALAESDKPWRIVLLHHALYPESGSDTQAKMRAAWIPVFERLGVDLVLQGHHRGYARFANVETGPDAHLNGPVYIASSSGAANVRDASVTDKDLQINQLYQVIDVDRQAITCRAYTPTGAVYDAFKIQKHADGTKDLIPLLQGHEIAHSTPKNAAPITD